MTGHPLDTAAMAAYQAFALSSADRLGEMPPWEALPPEARADWRAVADAVQMVTELAKLRSGAQTLGRIVISMSHQMEAARIEMLQNGLPDVDDSPEAEQWNGTETATEWFDRTAEDARADR